MATKKGLMDRVSYWSAQGKDCKAQTQLLEPPKGSSGGGDGFEVNVCHGHVALIGFPRLLLLESPLTLC
ncbi:hypothetical protein Bca101_032106 [Brassica carinata]